MRNVQLIIFDLDGTLLDAYPAIIKSFNFTMQRLGFPRQDAGAIRRAVGWGDENLLKPFVSKAFLKRALVMYRRHHVAALLSGSRLLPGARKVLVTLKKRGYRLAVASNRPTKFSLILIRHLGIARYFDYYLCADTLKHGKPHPEILNNIRKRFSLGTKDVLYVGDMAIDVQAGRRARIRTIAVATGSSTRQELRKEKPYRLISTITDLLTIL